MYKVQYHFEISTKWANFLNNLPSYDIRLFLHEDDSKLADQNIKSGKNIFFLKKYSRYLCVVFF